MYAQRSGRFSDVPRFRITSWPASRYVNGASSAARELMPFDVVDHGNALKRFETDAVSFVSIMLPM